MARVRYVKTLEQVKRAAEASPEFLPSSVRSIRCVYETDPAIAAAVIPRPLRPPERPEVCVTFSQVAIQLAPDVRFEIGSAIFGVGACYDGAPGLYLITMPMTTEQAVVPGRETYGEPKKIAQVELAADEERVSASVSRMGIRYLEVAGRLGESLGPRSFTETGYCFKAFPSCERGKAFDQDPLLVQLTWQHEHDRVQRVEGALSLRESPFDPVADLPLRRLVRLEYEVGRARSHGRVLAPVPGEWLLPFLHQRYDDPGVEGIEVPGPDCTRR
jgi:acetoacetate decarboxylase